jgi:hypothetical protein
VLIMKSKKGASLTFNTIIIAVLAIMVLLVLAFLLFRTSGDASKTMTCTSKGGLCLEHSCDHPIYSRQLHDVNCDQQGYVCCVPGIQ